MSQEMSFAQALTEARQIIVQQSSRIKSDLDKIKALQESVAAQAATLIERDRIISEQTVQLQSKSEQLVSLTMQLNQTVIAKEQAEAINDRQGQRLTQMQGLAAQLEQQISQHSEKVVELSRKLEEVQNQVPTQEDEEALAALSSLLSAKKGSVPIGKTGASNMRITGPEAQAA